MQHVESDDEISVEEAASHVLDTTREEREPFVVTGRIVPPDPMPPTRFFDPRDPSRSPDIILERVLVPRQPDSGGSWLARLIDWFGRELGDAQREEFRLRYPIGFYDADLDQVIIVPANLARFTTDLTSVPQLLTWLVPRTGTHLPAALLHDGLVHSPDEAPTYISDEEIPRAESDRVFRDAMGALGCTWVRRWLIWATVLIATLASGANRARWWLTIGLSGGLIVALGTLATIDLVDCRAPLPWMADRPWWQEVLLGGLAAIVISTVIALVFWYPEWRAGWIFCVALALLLHVTIAVAVISSVFALVESVVARRFVRAAIVGAFLVLVVGGLVAIGLAAC